MISLDLLLPDVAHDDLLIAKVVRKGTLPVGEYAFLEFHCIEKDCDCRRLIVHVLFEKSQKPMATISYGLDDKALGVEHDGRVYLDPLGPQSEHSKPLMELFLDAVEKQGHDERMRDHYRMVKKAIADPSHPVHQRLARAGVGVPEATGATEVGPEKLSSPPPPKVARNSPCPCGSGKKFKKCCLGKPPLRIVEKESPGAGVRSAPGDSQGSRARYGWPGSCCPRYLP